MSITGNKRIVLTKGWEWSAVNNMNLNILFSQVNELLTYAKILYKSDDCLMNIDE
jgi:hypothetical protein